MLWQVRRGLISGRAAFDPAAGGGGGPTDPSFSSTKLLLGFEDVDGSTGSPGMTDESSAAHGTGSAPGAEIDTAQFKFGASSLLLINGNGLKFTNHADYQFGSGSFTIEGFIRPANISSTGMILALWGGGGNFGWHFYQNGSALSWQVSTTGSDANVDMSGGTLVANTWQAVCIDYNGTKYRLYLDGAMVGSFTTPRTLFNCTADLGVGCQSDISNPFPFAGNIDEVRITKGVARYASDAGYTVATAAFPRS